MYTLAGKWIKAIYIVCVYAVLMRLPKEIKALEHVVFEFENLVGGSGFPRSPWRSGASGGSALHLFKGDAIKMTLCLTEQTYMEFSGLIYSNDGDGDNIRISTDDEPFVSFKTTETFHGWGKYWDEFKSLNLLGRPLQLGKGNHTVEFFIESSDCYGCEFDAFLITLDKTVDSKLLFCKTELLKSQTPSPCAMDIDSINDAAPKSNFENTVAQTMTKMSTRTAAKDSLTHTVTSQNSAVEEATPESPTVSYGRSSTLGKITPATTWTPSETSDIGTKTTESTILKLTDKTTTTVTRTATTDSIFTDDSTPEIESPFVSGVKRTTITESETAGTATDVITKAKVQEVNDRTTSHWIKRKDAKTTQTIRGKSAPIMTNQKGATKEILSGKLTTKSILRDMPQNSAIMSTLSQGHRQPVTTRSSLPFIEQHSFPTECLNINNIDIRFHAETLTNVEIITSPSANMRKERQSRKNATGNTSRGHLCKKNVIWQLGIHDNTNTELGPRTNDRTIDYDVNFHEDRKEPFPGLLIPGQNKIVVFRYVIPKYVDLKQRKIYFTLGLINVSADVIIGLQYIDRASKESSDIKFKTLRKGKQNFVWSIPTRSISPLLENQLLVYIAEDNPSLVIDYMALEYKSVKARTRPVLIAKVPKWKIRGKKYRKLKQAAKLSEKSSGMSVRIDEKLQNNTYAEISFIYKPNRKVLTVYKNGKIFPKHENRQLRRKNKIQGHKTNPGQLGEVTGFTFGENDLTITNVSFDPKMFVLYLKYEDSSFVRLFLQYSNLRTKIQIIDSSFSKLNFFSTYISDSLSAVNMLEADDSIRSNIIEKDVSSIRGNKFKFMNILPNSVFDVSNEYEVIFSN